MTGSNSDPLADFEQLASSYIELISPPLAEETGQEDWNTAGVDTRLSILSIGSLITTEEVNWQQQQQQPGAMPGIPEQAPVGEVVIAIRLVD
jgi:hypothetical protein